MIVLVKTWESDFSDDLATQVCKGLSVTSSSVYFYSASLSASVLNDGKNVGKWTGLVPVFHSKYGVKKFYVKSLSCGILQHIIYCHTYATYINICHIKRCVFQLDYLLKLRNWFLLWQTWRRLPLSRQIPDVLRIHLCSRQFSQGTRWCLHKYVFTWEERMRWKSIYHREATLFEYMVDSWN